MEKIIIPSWIPCPCKVKDCSQHHGAVSPSEIKVGSFCRVQRGCFLGRWCSESHTAFLLITPHWDCSHVCLPGCRRASCRGARCVRARLVRVSRLLRTLLVHYIVYFCVIREKRFILQSETDCVKAGPQPHFCFNILFSRSAMSCKNYIMFTYSCVSEREWISFIVCVLT